jgi:hypothetical protein
MNYKTFVLKAPIGARFHFRATDIVLDIPEQIFDPTLQNLEDQIRIARDSHFAEVMLNENAAKPTEPPKQQATTVLTKQQPTSIGDFPLRNPNMPLDARCNTCGHIYGVHLKGHNESHCQSFYTKDNFSTPCECKSFKEGGSS